MPAALLEAVERVAENCEPSLCSVLFMGGAGGSLRAGVTQNPLRLTHSVKSALTYVTCGGAEAYVWPGGGITVMVDVTRTPSGSFGYFPTPALVAPIEFTMRVSDYISLGGHAGRIQPIEEVLPSQKELRKLGRIEQQTDPNAERNYAWEGHVVNRKKTQRLHREEGLSVRKRRGRKKATGTRAPLLTEAVPNARWSVDLVHDQFAQGRRFRILNVIDDVTKECLAAVVDTSLSGRRVARELTALIARRGPSQA